MATQKSCDLSADWGLEFYTGNYLPTDGCLKGKDGCSYDKHGGFVLETQKYPDAINKKFGHDPILRPGQVYDHQVTYKFFFWAIKFVPIFEIQVILLHVAVHPFNAHT